MKNKITKRKRTAKARAGSLKRVVRRPDLELELYEMRRYMI